MLVVGVEVTSTVGGRFRRCYTGVVTDGLRRSVVPGGWVWIWTIDTAVLAIILDESFDNEIIAGGLRCLSTSSRRCEFHATCGLFHMPSYQVLWSTYKTYSASSLLITPPRCVFRYVQSIALATQIRFVSWIVLSTPLFSCYRLRQSPTPVTQNPLLQWYGHVSTHQHQH